MDSRKNKVEICSEKEAIEILGINLTVRVILIIVGAVKRLVSTPQSN